MIGGTVFYRVGPKKVKLHFPHLVNSGFGVKNVVVCDVCVM